VPQSEEERFLEVIVIYIIYYIYILNLYKDLRRCVTGVMHEHSFMKIKNIYLIYIIY
jgi:hypothetical protein